LSLQTLLFPDSYGLEWTENLIADEFSAELAEGVAYVAGHDEESRPVMVIFNSLSPSLY